MLLKPSVYNAYTKNEEECIILYNSYNDDFNIAKFRKEDSVLIEPLLQSEKIEVQDKTNQWIEWLCKRNFLVQYDENEDTKLQLKFLQYITDSKLHLYILPTFACNLRCKYCYENHSNVYMNIEVQESIIKFVKKNISKYTGLHISWFGGEPLLSLDTIKYMSEKFINLCQACHRSYEADMSTNGYLLTENTIKLLISLKVKYFQITLDGLEQIHNRLKTTIDGHPTFSTILNNLIVIRDKIKTRNLVVVIRSNFIKSNLLEIDEYIDFFHSLFQNDRRFYFAPGSAGNWGYAGEECDPDMFIEPSHVNEIFDKLLNSNKVLNYGFFSNFTKHGRNICYASKLNSFAIDPKGRLYKCTCNFDIPENEIGYINSFGDMVINDSKYSIWVVGALKYLTSICSECFFSCKCCGSYCIANSLIKNDNVFSCFPPFSKMYFNQQILLYDKFSDLQYVILD